LSQHHHCRELFFLPNTLFQNNSLGATPFFLSQRNREVKLKNVAFHSFLPHFPRSAMHEAVGETILPNNFYITD
jgi:hypothetical protein